MDFQKVIDAVRETRSLTLPYFGNVEVKTFKSSDAHDAVTQIDQDVELFLKERLATITPEIAFVGEEFGGDRSAERFWILDPIDGTGCYLRGLPYCTTMLALVDHGVVTHSIIYDFVRDELFHAERSKGAYRDGERIHVAGDRFKSVYISCETNTKHTDNHELFFAIRNSVGFFAHIAAGYEFALVACGKADGRIAYDAFGKDYDFAPGSLLVEEAGGIVRNFGSESYDYTNYNFIAVSPFALQKLLQNDIFAQAMRG